MRPILNRTVLMSGADYFDDTYAINAYMDDRIPVNRQKAIEEHARIRVALTQAGVNIESVPPPAECQDGVYTANWALCRGDVAILSRLPNKRKAEEKYAEKVLRDYGKRIIRPPGDLRFSGQGDALPCGHLLFMGSSYRTDWKVHEFVAHTLDYSVVSLQTVPQRRLWGRGPIVKNAVTGWPDSFFYDIDLALAVLRPPTKNAKGLIAWCPQAFTAQSRKKLRELEVVEKIEVSYREAKHAYACNLVSTGHTVIMSAEAPDLRRDIEGFGITVVTPKIHELAKGGGYIRCTSLTFDNN